MNKKQYLTKHLHYLQSQYKRFSKELETAYINNDNETIDKYERILTRVQDEIEDAKHDLSRC